VWDVALPRGLRVHWYLWIRTPDDARLLGRLGMYCRTDRDPTNEERAAIRRAANLVTLAVDRAARSEELGHLALHDSLTGLPNRSLAIDRLEQALWRLADHDSMLAVLFVDLDRFKTVNDRLGHETGDALLVAVARRLSASVRRQDTVARLGGDEFVVLCEDLADEHQAEELAQRAAEALSAPYTFERAEISVTPSIGIAFTRRSTDLASSLLRDADAAMYRAKRLGGGRYEVFDSNMHTQAVARLLTERALRQALEHNELRVVFQPQFTLADGQQVAVETLLRWAHPTRGLVSPADFIPVAEETGLIVPIGSWVLNQACDRLAANANRTDDGPPLSVAVNISARQLLRPDFARQIARELRDRELDPSQLCLEITEGTLLDDLDANGEALRALKELGVRLSIDDFGTGGSSLTYLRQFPFDELKIDHSFIAGLGRSAADDAIVAATIDMAHALGMVVSAEGIETAEQRRRLTELGCDRGQGYLLAAPEEVPSRHLFLVAQQPA